MRFAVTGGRDYSDTRVVARAINKMPADAVMVNSMALGADLLARTFWSGTMEAHSADWDRHGKAAGPMRNREMLDSGLDLLIAFPGGRGTAHMTDICVAAGVPVVQCG